MSITVYEMAEMANVSIATISRAMNPATRGKVSAETLERIDRLAEKHRFTPNLAAKHLGRTSYKTIGLLFPQHAGIFLEDYYSKILAGVSDGLLESDYDMKLVMLKCRKNKWDNYDFKSGEAIDALIVTHWHAFFSERRALEKIGVPTVIVSDVENDVKNHFVSGDHYQGGKLAAEHLYSQGHRRFGIFMGPADSEDSHLRVQGFRHFLKEKGISLHPSALICGEFQEEKAAGLLPAFLEKNSKVTAIFCCNDGMAFGVIKKLKELGIRCPEKISVMGYDDDKRGEKTGPPLTSVRVPLYELGKQAAGRLLEHLKRPNRKKDGEFFYGKTLLPVELVVRKSVRKI